MKCPIGHFGFSRLIDTELNLDPFRGTPQDMRRLGSQLKLFEKIMKIRYKCGPPNKNDVHVIIIIECPIKIIT